ncbi:MAG: response regulator [Pseudomonadota bacterium]
MRGKRPVLLVEDDEVDAMTVERAMSDLQVANELIIVDDGEYALQWLNDEEHLRPCIILLDLNMPRMNGIEFLTVIKRDPVLRRIPVVVLTSSKEEQDLVAGFDLGVAGYLIKPPTYEDFLEILRTVNLYWTASQIPGEM